MINEGKDVNGKMESFRWTQEEDFEKYVNEQVKVLTLPLQKEDGVGV